MQPPVEERTRPATMADASYWISISDLMAGLVTIFILALIYHVITYQRQVESLTDNEVVRTEILRTLEAKINERDQFLKVEIDEVHGVLRLPNEVLFDSGSDALRGLGRQNVAVLSHALYEVLSDDRFDRRVETVFIEGHTDKVPMAPNSRFQSNWELSAQRAINTWREMLKSAQLDSLKNALGQPIFSCSGYAASRPVESIDNLAQNRRIDLRFAMSPPAIPGAKEADDTMPEDNQVDDISFPALWKELLQNIKPKP